jgi:hypothetical protein
MTVSDPLKVYLSLTSGTCSFRWSCNNREAEVRGTPEKKSAKESIVATGAVTPFIVRRLSHNVFTLTRRLIDLMGRNNSGDDAPSRGTKAEH